MNIEHELQKEPSATKDILEIYTFLKPHLECLNDFNLTDDELDKLANNAMAAILKKYHNFHTDSKEIQAYDYEWTPKSEDVKVLLQHHDLKLINSSLKREMNIIALTTLNAFVIYGFNNKIGDSEKELASLIESIRMFLIKLIEEENIYKFVEGAFEGELLEDKIARILTWVENILPLGISILEVINKTHKTRYPDETIYPTVVYETIEGNIAVFYVTNLWLQEHAIYKSSN